MKNPFATTNTQAPKKATISQLNNGNYWAVITTRTTTPTGEPLVSQSGNPMARITFFTNGAYADEYILEDTYKAMFDTLADTPEDTVPSLPTPQRLLYNLFISTRTNPMNSQNKPKAFTTAMKELSGRQVGTTLYLQPSTNPNYPDPSPKVDPSTDMFYTREEFDALPEYTLTPTATAAQRKITNTQATAATNAQDKRTVDELLSSII